MSKQNDSFAKYVIKHIESKIPNFLLCWMVKKGIAYTEFSMTIVDEYDEKDSTFKDFIELLSVYRNRKYTAEETFRTFQQDIVKYQGLKAEGFTSLRYAVYKFWDWTGERDLEDE